MKLENTSWVYVIKNKEIKERGGTVVGESHKNGGVPFVLKDTGTHIEEEGEEVNVPREIGESDEIYEFEGTNEQILNKILKLGGLSLNNKVTEVKSGDIVICIKSAKDSKKRKYKGTVRQILSAINESRGCNHIESGAEVVESGEKKKLKKGGYATSNWGTQDNFDELYAMFPDNHAEAKEIWKSLNKTQKDAFINELETTDAASEHNAESWLEFVKAKSYDDWVENATNWDEMKKGGSTDWFWNYAYRHYMRDASLEDRKKVKRKFISEGLALDGESPRHAYIVVSITSPKDFKSFKKRQKVSYPYLFFKKGGNVSSGISWIITGTHI